MASACARIRSPSTSFLNAVQPLVEFLGIVGRAAGGAERCVEGGRQLLQVDSVRGVRFLKVTGNPVRVFAESLVPHAHSLSVGDAVECALEMSVDADDGKRGLLELRLEFAVQKLRCRTAPPFADGDLSLLASVAQ